MSHHKKPVKPSLPASCLLISTDSHLEIPNLQGDQGEVSSLSRPFKVLAHHPWNSQVNLLSSDLETLSSSESLESGRVASGDEAMNLVKRLGSYQVLSNFEISSLLDPEFTQTYIRSGSLIALSISKIAGDDLFAIDGHGTVHLRLCQSTYHSLGLTGRPSKFGPPNQYYVVEIDLRHPAMRPGRKGYERTKRCLEAFPASVFDGWLEEQMESTGRRWDVALTWVNQQGELKPVQLSKRQCESTIKSCSPITDVQEKFLTVHPISTMNFSSEEALLELFEWIGRSTFSRPETVEKGCSRVMSIRSLGFFHPLMLIEIFKALQGMLPLVIVSAHTAPGSPFSFLISRQTRFPRQLPIASLNTPAKKVKRGKSSMRGPERGTDAGPTSWSLVAFTCCVTSSVPPGPPSIHTPSSPSNSLKRASLSVSSHDSKPIVTHKKFKSAPGERQGVFPCRWILYESVGSYDTHC